jgi:hypothetical protein
MSQSPPSEWSKRVLKNSLSHVFKEKGKASIASICQGLTWDTDQGHKIPKPEISLVYLKGVHQRMI